MPGSVCSEQDLLPFLSQWCLFSVGASVHVSHTVILVAD